MEAHAATNQADNPQDIISDAQFNGFLDGLMGKLYDTVQEHKPKGITPAITMYRRRDYDEPFDVRSLAMPPVEIDQQFAVFEQAGKSSAMIADGRIPVATFLVTMGVRTPPKVEGKELTQADVEVATEEVCIIAGATIDGRMAQSVYSLRRDKVNSIVKIDLSSYIPARPMDDVNEQMRIGLLDAFYNGHRAQYIENIDKQREKEGGTSHGGFIVPD